MPVVVSQIELLGFKSFALPTRLVFPEGLTAIVGPNGCGKSNIVDAIRWVLGEQRPSVLRCETMEQLIFNGSRALKPLGMAEVSLRLENARGLFPIDLPQVVLTRRLYRNGESEYLLNGVPCRLRDLQELLLDSGLAPHGYSVIELKMVEELLSGRVEERRRLLEEAAGVGKYKLRQREAQRRLSEVRLELQRLEDLLAELRQRVHQLGQQAEQARQYRRWESELHRLQQQYLALLWYTARKQLDSLATSAEQLRSERIALEQQLAQLRGGIPHQQERYAQLRQQVDALHQRVGEHRQRIQELRERLVALEERIQLAQRSRERVDQERRQIQREREELEQQHALLLRRLQEHEAALQQLQERSADVQRRTESLRQKRQRWQQQHEPLRQELHRWQQRHDELRIQWERLQAQQEQLHNRRAQLDEELAALEQHLHQQRELLATAEEDLHTATQVLEQLHQRLQQQNAHSTVIAEELAEQRRRLAQCQQELLAVQTQREGLEALEQQHELVQYLRQHYPELEPQTVAELVRLPEELRDAFAAAAAPLLEAVLISRLPLQEFPAHLRAAIRAGELLLPRGEESSPEPIRAEGIRGWLVELVHMPPAVASALTALLGRVLVVDNLAVGQTLLEQCRADAVVTLTGEFLHRCGLLRWRDGANPWVGRLQRLQELQAREAELQALQQQLNARIQQLQQEHHRAIAVLEQLQRERHQAEQHQQQARARVEALQLQLRMLETTFQQRQLQREALQEEHATLEERLYHLRAEYRRCEETLEQLHRQRSELEQQLERLQPAFEAALEQSRQHELEQTRAQYELENLRAQLQQLRNRLQQLAQRWEALERDLLQAEELLQRQSRQQQELQQQLQQREHEYAELHRQYSQSLAELEQCAAELQRSQHQHEALLEQLHTLSQQLHQLELQQQHARLQADHAAGQLSEQFGLLPEQVELPAPSPSAEQLQQRIHTYSRRLASLGTVNFRALEEFEEHSQRLQFLQSQWQDLREAERSLVQAIEQAQQAAVERFRQTFEQVRRNFQRLFRLLFEDGDEADIRLVGENVLEAGIEIIAKPRGKRPQSIEQLSGGEKTLVAIAFLFALYLVKPSPFCILDEIDAPLDDANIERFVRMLRGFEESTQFVLITHNRRTMEAVDALYGVTMQPEGVSKVVAVRLRAPASV